MALEIIGPGFGRTGTNSLKIALEQLGFGPCHHMFEVRDNPEQLPAWEAAARGERVDWDQVFRGYRAQVDWPGARYWRELARHWPEAKVILTVRDPDEWFDSVQATIATLPRRARHASRSPHANAIAAMGQELVAMQVFEDRLSTARTRRASFASISPRCRPRSRPSACSPSTCARAGGPCATSSAWRCRTCRIPKTNSSKAFVEEEWKQE